MTRTLRTLLILGLTLTPLAARAQRPRVAVLVVGDDPEVAGNLQMQMERHIDSIENVLLVPSTEFAPRIARRVRRPDPGRWRPDVTNEDRLRRAKDLYFKDDLVQSIQLLEQVESSWEEQKGVPVAARVDLLLWQTAVHLALEEVDTAREHARAALTLDPILQVDRTVFPPSVDELVREAASNISQAVVQVKTNPPGAWIEIDERLVDIEFRVPDGAHRIVISANYYEPIERKFALKRFIVLNVGLPLALRPTTHRWLMRALDEGRATQAGSRLRFSQLRQTIGADALVVLAAHGTDGGRRALIYYRGGEVRLSPAVEHARSQGVLFNWTRSVLGELARPDRFERWSVWAGWQAQASVSGAYGSRFRRLRSADGSSGYKAGFNGQGFDVHLDADRRGLLASIDFQHLAYPGPTAPVTLTTGVEKLTGGEMIASRLGLGYRHRFGSEGELARSSVTATVGGRLWVHGAHDVTDANGPLGVLTSYRWLGVDLAVDGAYVIPISIPGDASVLAGLAVSPFSSFHEDGELTGIEPETTTSYFWSLGTEWRAWRRWSVRLRYQGALLETRFLGQASVPIDPPIVDARWRESRHTWTLGIRRTF